MFLADEINSRISCTVTEELQCVTTVMTDCNQLTSEGSRVQLLLFSWIVTGLFFCPKKRGNPLRAFSRLINSLSLTVCSVGSFSA